MHPPVPFADAGDGLTAGVDADLHRLDILQSLREKIFETLTRPGIHQEFAFGSREVDGIKIYSGLARGNGRAKNYRQILRHAASRCFSWRPVSRRQRAIDARARPPQSAEQGDC